MAYNNNEKKSESVFGKRIRAGKRRTYFFDVRTTKGNDYYLTITESRKRFDSDGFDRHKLYVYKEDFNKFIKGLNEVVDHVKTELMPDFDFDSFSHEDDEEGGYEGNRPATNEAYKPSVADQTSEPAPIVEPVPSASAGDNGATEEVDKW